MKGDQTRILVVDDEEAIREVLQMRLQTWGFEVELAPDVKTACSSMDSEEPDIVISDVVMPELSGLDLLKTFRKKRQDLPVILMTAHGSIDMAVEAMKEGAEDFLTKPLDYGKLRSILDAVCSDIKLKEESALLSSRLERGSGFGEFVGVSKPMKKIYSLISDLAGTDASVLISGESGTGKELVARTVHRLSFRNDGPFVAVNSAAIPADLMESEIFGHEKGAFTGAVGVRPGCFELADKGTLLLDEIAEMPVGLQPKLLRVLEDGQVRRLGGKQFFTFDVRVLAATNRDPSKAVQEGMLREDLYYRLNLFTIHMPPLRERKEDIHLLAQHFISVCNKKHRANVRAIREEALQVLINYSWPGNVRELKNVMERAVILAKGEWIDLSHLPPYLQHATVEPSDQIVLPLGTSAAEAEKKLILRTLELTGNNKAEAARQLGIDVKTIRNKLKTYGLS